MCIRYRRGVGGTARTKGIKNANEKGQGKKHKQNEYIHKDI
jgi:hypothetical protein